MVGVRALQRVKVLEGSVETSTVKERRVLLVFPAELALGERGGVRVGVGPKGYDFWQSPNGAVLLGEEQVMYVAVAAVGRVLKYELSAGVVGGGE